MEAVIFVNGIILTDLIVKEILKMKKKIHKKMVSTFLLNNNIAILLFFLFSNSIDYGNKDDNIHSEVPNLENIRPLS